LLRSLVTRASAVQLVTVGASESVVIADFVCLTDVSVINVVVVAVDDRAGVKGAQRPSLKNWLVGQITMWQWVICSLGVGQLEVSV